MKLLIVATASAIATLTASAHPKTQNAVMLHSVCLEDSLSSDSLQKLYQRIDSFSIFELKKWRESYIYKNRTQPSYQNKQILLYIEERMKLVK